MPTQIKTDPHTGKQYYLITNVAAKEADREIDLNAESWELPYSIDDSDLTFDGKPLNLLYEENRWQAEHHVDGVRERTSSHSSSEKSHVNPTSFSLISPLKLTWNFRNHLEAAVVRKSECITSFTKTKTKDEIGVKDRHSDEADPVSIGCRSLETGFRRRDSRTVDLRGYDVFAIV
jgi:hypothetical protein